MLTSSLIDEQPARNVRKERTLWHDRTLHTLSLGCADCPDRPLCGGLQIEHALFDCLGFCCGNPQDCDTVCRNRPEEFSERVREIRGFGLDNVPMAPVLTPPELPAVVPVLYNRNKRRAPFSADMVCIPLYQVINGQTGKARHGNALKVAEAFAIGAGVRLLVTGTAIDPPLERWWSLGERRRDAISGLRDLGVAFATTPNYSLFTNQPRWDDLHSMKRIAIVHEEFLREGLPTALHVNARTDRDWERWRDYVAARSEITHIAFEFATGAGWAGRIEWHAAQLVKLAGVVNRPLHLVVRGGGCVLPLLVSAFARITFLETSTFVKTIHRRRAVVSETGSLHWRHCPTRKTESLDELLADNWRTVAASYARSLERDGMPRQAA